MNRISTATLFVIFALAACTGDLPARSPQEAANPRAPEAKFDPGPNPLGGVLSAPSDASDAASSVGHDHRGMSMPMPSSSASPAAAPVGKPR